MDRQGNRRTSSFFSRIRNPDVLKSPYPRHLAQSVRPTPISYSNAHDYGRPAPAHSLAAWQNPASRLNHAATPVSGVPRGQAGPARNPLPVVSSVQPIRTRPTYVTEPQLIPGSCRPTHHLSPSAVRDPLSSAAPCVLQNWFVQVDPKKNTVNVRGDFTKPNGAMVSRHSSPIEMAIDSHTLMSATGSIYRLVGAVNVDKMLERGFPEHLIHHFTNGFPRNWKQVIAMYQPSISFPGDTRRQPNPPSFQSGTSRSGGFDAAMRGSFSTRPISTVTRHNESHGDPQTSAGRRNFSAIAEADGATSGTSPIFPERGVRMDRDSRLTSNRAADEYSSHSSVYRSGADLFTGNRFPQAIASNNNPIHGKSTADMASPDPRHRVDGTASDMIAPNSYSPDLGDIAMDTMEDEAGNDSAGGVKSSMDHNMVIDGPIAGAVARQKAPSVSEMIQSSGIIDALRSVSKSPDQDAGFEPAPLVAQPVKRRHPQNQAKGKEAAVVPKPQSDATASVGSDTGGGNGKETQPVPGDRPESDQRDFDDGDALANYLQATGSSRHANSSNLSGDAKVPKRKPRWVPKSVKNVIEHASPEDRATSPPSSNQKKRPSMRIVDSSDESDNLLLKKLASTTPGHHPGADETPDSAGNVTNVTPEATHGEASESGDDAVVVVFRSAQPLGTSTPTRKHKKIRRTRAEAPSSAASMTPATATATATTAAAAAKGAASRIGATNVQGPATRQKGASLNAMLTATPTATPARITRSALRLKRTTPTAPRWKTVSETDANAAIGSDSTHAAAGASATSAEQAQAHTPVETPTKTPGSAKAKNTDAEPNAGADEDPSPWLRIEEHDSDFETDSSQVAAPIGDGGNKQLDGGELPSKIGTSLAPPNPPAADDSKIATPAKPSASATPKKPAGSLSGKAKEKSATAASSSITRSGRKIRKPQEWWANARDHLNGSGHEESSIKYKWGSGDLFLVKGDRHVNLSELYLQGGADVDLAHDAEKSKEPDVSDAGGGEGKTSL